MPVNSKRQEFLDWSPIWEKTRDGIAGQAQVKKKREKYLPKLNGQILEDYESYLARAQFINYSARVRDLARGMLFRKEAIVEGIPDNFLENIDLCGTPFSYFSEKVCEEIMAVNRVGILVDYSTEQKRPFLTMYKAENIINWQTDVVNGIQELTRVILEGTVFEPSPNDPYMPKKKTVWKELCIEKGVYIAKDWEQVTNGQNKENSFTLTNEYIPEINGAKFDFIPFYFVTSKGITTEITGSTLQDLVNVNFGHYINSADFENMIHWTGARTIIATGWDDKEPFPVGGCAVGSEGFDAKFLEASSDSALQEAMKQKEEQMAVLGAAMISGKGRYVASAKTMEITSQGENASLADISVAMSTSMLYAMQLFIEWAGGNLNNVVIKYNTDFESAEMDYTKLTPLMGAVQSGYMSFETFFYNLQKNECYAPGTKIEDEIKAIEETMLASIQRRDALIPPQLQNSNSGDNAESETIEE